MRAWFRGWRLGSVDFKEHLGSLLGLIRATAVAAKDSSSVTCTREGIKAIEEELQTVSMASLGLDVGAHKHVRPQTQATDIRYLHVAEESGSYAVGIFVLPPGAAIPLHDHPAMCVLSRCLYGTLEMTRFDWEQAAEPTNGDSGVISSNSSSYNSGSSSSSSSGGGGGSSLDGTSSQAAPAAAAPATMRGPPGHMARLRYSGARTAPFTEVLFPVEGNIHMFQAGDEGAAVLDVLLPPYGSERDCTYYQAVGAENAGALVVGNVYELRPCEPPVGFEVVRGEYVRPPAAP